MKLAICMPSVAVNPSRSTVCFGAMTAYTLASGCCDDLIIKSLAQGYIDLGREMLAYEVLTMGADAIFWLDHDHTYPWDSIQRLMKRDMPIVGCGYRSRSAPEFIRRPDLKNCVKATGLKNLGLWKTPYLLGGFTLVRKEVYEKMPRPWYRAGWGLDPSQPGAHIGEDIDWSRRARENGFDLYLDMDLTPEIGHLAELELKWDMDPLFA